MNNSFQLSIRRINSGEHWAFRANGKFDAMLTARKRRQIGQGD